MAISTSEGHRKPLACSCLPPDVRWGDPVGSFDMDIRNDRMRVYEQVLREGTEADVRYFVNPDELVDVFEALVLPPHVRRSWEEWFERHDFHRSGEVEPECVWRTGALELSPCNERPTALGRDRDVEMGLGD
jgi:hypothetical protein